MILTLLAQATTEPKPQPNPLVSLAPILLLVVLFYFVLIRPQRRARQAQMELIRAIEVGDEVESIGGMFGTVRKLEDDVVWVEIAAGTTVKLSRGAIRRKIVEEPESEGPASG